MLYHSLGEAYKDEFIQTIIRRYDEVFPGRIAAYYVEGSYADGTQLTSSDIDLVLIFFGQLTTANGLNEANLLWQQCINPSHIELDLSVRDEESLQKGVWPHLKLGSALIYGQDILKAYPIIAIDTWAQMRMYAAHYLIMHVYQRATDKPLAFPSPDDEFYGYANRTVTLDDGREVLSTRNLVRTTGWAATALIAELAGQYVVHKRDCHHIYHHYIGDQWSSLLEEIYYYCRSVWMYLLPNSEKDRRQLRTICEHTLAFEQYFVDVYQQRYGNDEL